MQQLLDLIMVHMIYTIMLIKTTIAIIIWEVEVKAQG